MCFGRASVPSYQSKQMNLCSSDQLLPVLCFVGHDGQQYHFGILSWNLVDKLFPVPLGIQNLEWLNPACIPSMSVHTYLLTHRVYSRTYIPGWAHKSAQTDTLSTHTNTNGTNSLILPPSLAEHEEGLSGIDIKTDCVWWKPNFTIRF